MVDKMKVYIYTMNITFQTEVENKIKSFPLYALHWFSDPSTWYYHVISGEKSLPFKHTTEHTDYTDYIVKVKIILCRYIDR